jgi:hypothetical protein
MNYGEIPSTARKVNLKEWVSIHERMPSEGQAVEICDADWYTSFADYEFYAVFNGKDFIEEKLGRVAGVLYWKPRTAAKINSLG